MRVSDGVVGGEEGALTGGVLIGLVVVVVEWSKRSASDLVGRFKFLEIR